MSEKSSHSPEHHLEQTEASKEVRQNLENILDKAEQTKHHPHEQMGDIQRSIEKHALSGKEIHLPHKEKAKAPPLFVNRELKQHAYNRNLTHIRRRLSGPEKMGSKLIHQPVVNKISQLSEQTIARPSGLLGGGVLALLGSSFLFYMAKHYGFEYNFLAFFLLFLIGFAVGIVAEFGIKLARR